MLLFFSIARCALDYTASYVVHPLEAPSFSLTTRNGDVVVGRGAQSVLRIIPDDSEDGAELTLNGSGICIYNDSLETCKRTKRAKFRIKQKRNGYRIKTETRGFFRKLLMEKCLTMISGKPRLRRCSVDNDGQIFLFKKQHNEQDEDSDLDRRPIFNKSFQERNNRESDFHKDESNKEDWPRGKQDRIINNRFKDASNVSRRINNPCNNGMKKEFCRCNPQI